MLSAIVLAAGLSKRMGAVNKLLLPYKGSTIIEATLSQILDANIEEVIVVTGHEADLVTSTMQHFPVTIIHNTDYGKGMTTSIQKAVEVAKGNSYMICLGDMFTITSPEYVLLKNNFEKKYEQDDRCICIPRYNNEKGNPVIFSAFYKDAILMHQDMEGCKGIVQANMQHVHWVEMDNPHILEDLDYPEDYKKISNE